MFGTISAIISGALMSIQGVFNSEVTKTAGVWTTNVFVQFGALLICFAIWAIRERNSFMTLIQVEPKYMLLGGVMGAFITYTVIQSMGQLGPAKAVMLIVISQLLVAYLIEQFGLFGTDKIEFQMRKLAGLVLMIAGVIIFKWDK